METSELIPCVVVALFGLAFGSFLNVCIYRIPRGESIISPRSHCPHCQAPVRWYDNLPVLSYVVLRGRCRACKKCISPVYPLVEVATSAVLVLTFMRHGLSPEFIKFALLGMLSLVLMFTDLRERRIPHAVTLFGAGVGIVLSFVVPVDARPLQGLLDRAGLYSGELLVSLIASLSGALVGGGLLYGVGEGFYYLGGKQREYLGFGDVMLLVMVGTYLGIPLTLLTILLGSLVGTILALPFELLSARFRHYAWPYGTFLGGAAIFSSLGGDHLLEAYLRWSGLG